MRFAFVILAAAAAAGCSGGKGASAPDFADVLEAATSDATEVGPEAPTVPTEVTEPFRLVYASTPVPPTTATSDECVRDLHAAVTDRGLSLTKTLAALDPTLTCALGCFVDDALSWIAVATEVIQAGDKTNGTWNVRYGRIATDLSVHLDKGGQLTGVAYLRFSGGFLFYSAPLPACPDIATGTPATCYDIHRVPLDSPGNDEVVATFPNKDGMEGSQFHGHFEIGEDGKTLILQNPTNKSQTIFVLGDEMVREDPPICVAPDPNGDPNACGPAGTSSIFRDNDPIALSADRRWLVFATVADNTELRLYKHDLVNRVRTYSVLLGPVPGGYFSGDEAQNPCYNRQDWQYTTVLGPIRFVNGGADVMFIGEEDCARYDNCQKPTKKPWTNLVRIALDRIGNGVPLAPADLRPTTFNPAANVGTNEVISTYDLSPTGEFTVFAATPSLVKDGTAPIADCDLRATGDSEVYVTRTDGTAAPVQVTSDSGDLRVTTVQAVPAAQ